MTLDRGQVLEPLLGNSTAEKVLLFLFAHREGYARQIAQAFALPVSVVQKQLLRLERGNVLASRQAGRTRMFQMNPTYAFAPELAGLLKRAFDFVPASERTPYEPQRTRPRATGKRL